MSGAPQRKPQIIVGIVGFKAYLCHCFIKIIAIPLIIRRIAIIFLQCRMCGRLSPPGPVPTLGHVEGTEKVSEHSEITQRTIDNYLVVRWIFCIFK